MNGFLSSVIWRGISEYLLIKQDIKRFRGKKNVIAAMAVDRNDPEFKKAESYFEGLDESGDFVFVKEDHPNGPIHERFACQPQDFCFAVVDKAGNIVTKVGRAMTLAEIIEKLPPKLDHKIH